MGLDTLTGRSRVRGTDKEAEMHTQQLTRFECFHRRHWSNGSLLPNGAVYAYSPREALVRFKALTPTARTHIVAKSAVS